MVAFELAESKFGQTHLVKVIMKKEDSDALTEEQRNCQPILGNMKPLITKQRKMDVANTAGALPDDGTDLPF